MTDDRFPPSADDDEMLSAYLLGDLPEPDATAFEARLADDPGLGSRLDALATALVALGGHDDTEPPDGFEQRLDERLREARGGEAAVVSLDRAREERARSRGWWTAIGTVAAVVAVGGVMATSALRGVGGGDDSAEVAAGGAESATESATLEDADAFDDAAAPSAAGGGTADSGSDMSADGAAPGRAMAAPSQPNAPVLFDDQAVVRNEGRLRRRYAMAPEVIGLLGLPVDEAATVAAAFTTAVQRAEPFAGGGFPADCLDTVTTAADRPLIPARVETLRYDEQPALAYVLVTASPDSDELDRVETWVVAPDSCTTLVFQQR